MIAGEGQLNERQAPLPRESSSNTRKYKLESTGIFSCRHIRCIMLFPGKRWEEVVVVGDTRYIINEIGGTSKHGGSLTFFNDHAFTTAGKGTLVKSTGVV